ncbi:MAG: DUF5615 family PIN-like protein [Acidobacteria bacterium]|nr:DUF5615 family PIN-like protein [Acidobacteriota bacterium]
MKFVGDESVESQIIERLRFDGHEVWYVAEMNPGISDDEVLQTANTFGCILITGDKDFGELVFREKKVHQGVLLLRLTGITNQSKAEIVSAVIISNQDQLAGAFSVITPGGLRHR